MLDKANTAFTQAMLKSGHVGQESRVEKMGEGKWDRTKVGQWAKEPMDGRRVLEERGEREPGGDNNAGENRA